MRVETSLSAFLVIFVILLGHSQESSFEDERCVCTCPKKLCPNGTGPIFVKMVAPNDCLCDLVVVPAIQCNVSQHLDFCHFCKCQHETRNTTTIKVVVIFIICVMALLSIYMLFLMCLDPLLQKRQTSYTRQIDDDVTLGNVASGSREYRSTGEATHRASGPRFTRQNSLIGRVTSEQQKWKGTVEEQRRNIYDTHSMLN